MVGFQKPYENFTILFLLEELIGCRVYGFQGFLALFMVGIKTR